MTPPPPPPNNNNKKELKCESLCVGIQRMWNLKCMISDKWNHQNRNKMFKEIFGNDTRKTFNRITTNDSCTWNITHNTESAVV